MFHLHVQEETASFSIYTQKKKFYKMFVLRKLTFNAPNLIGG